jgi:hypothetical protein
MQEGKLHASEEPPLLLFPETGHCHCRRFQLTNDRHCGENLSEADCTRLCTRVCQKVQVELPTYGTIVL